MVRIYEALGLVFLSLITTCLAQRGFNFPTASSSLFNRMSSGSLFPQTTFPQFPSFDIPKSCSDAKESCANRCGSELMMNFQCNDQFGGVSSSCSCTSTPTGGSSDTPRCQKAKQICQLRCHRMRVKFACSDNGRSFSKSCSCVSPFDEEIEVDISDSLDSFSKVPFTTPQVISVKDVEQDPVDSFIIKSAKVEEVEEEEEAEAEETDLGQNGESEDEDEFSIFENFPSIKMDAFSNHNTVAATTVSGSVSSVQDDGGMDARCDLAKKQCMIQCQGLKMDFDCKSEGGSFAKSCSCAGDAESNTNTISSSSSSVSSSGSVVKEPLGRWPLGM